MFFCYGGWEHGTRDPYPFISYLYYRVDMKKYAAEAMDIFDSIVIPMLSDIGDISIIDNPNYAPEDDKKILAAIEQWKEKYDNLE